MGSFASVCPATPFPRMTFEQLEERIVLDGATDDLSCRVDLFNAQVEGTHSDSDQIITETVLAASGADVDPLVLETGTEWLPDGTWHYWEQDWDASGNGYRFDAWQDGSSSFHQIQWDAALNSKGTHNGFDYNLQRDGSWTYQAIQWDAQQNGYSYDANSAGYYVYEAHQWSDGMGYDYTSTSNGTWSYHTVQQGEAANDRVSYGSDSGGFWDYTYTWANGVTWNDSSAKHPFLIKDINAGEFSSIPQYLCNVNGTCFFNAFDYTFGAELWRSDATEAGTVLVKDINPGHYTNQGNPQHLTAVNGTVYFSANDGLHGRELWKSDGTQEGTVMVKDIGTDTYSSDPEHLTNVAGVLYFSAWTPEHGRELWKSDGTTSGTVMVADINPGSYSSNPTELTAIGNTVFFTADDQTDVWDLWRSNGESTSTIKIMDIDLTVAYADISNPYNLTNVNGALYFAISEELYYAWLYKSDGTGTGNALMRWFEGPHGGVLGELTDCSGTLYFAAVDKKPEGFLEFYGNELWTSDGTPDGTVMVTNGDFGPIYITNSGSTIYFSGDDGLHGRELFRFGGTVADMVKDINPGSEGSNPSDLTDVNGRLYFTAFDGIHGRELWTTDSSALGTAMVAETCESTFPGTYEDRGPEGLTNVNGTLFFIAYDKTYGAELWALHARPRS